MGKDADKLKKKQLKLQYKLKKKELKAKKAEKPHGILGWVLKKSILEIIVKVAAGVIAALLLWWLGLKR